VTFLVGLPSYIAVGALLYLVADSGSRWIALVACAGLFAGLLVSLRKQASAGRSSGEAVSPRGERGT
jgi:hypothetical protein